MTEEREAWKDLTPQDLLKIKKIRELNDRLRKTLPRTQDMIVLMGDLAHADEAEKLLAYAETRKFDCFNEDNDPYGEHDCGCFTITYDGEEKSCIFKIDYYDLNLKFGSVDASDENVTRRVLSIFYASDY